MEKLVNDRIRENLEVTVEEMSLDEARRTVPLPFSMRSTKTGAGRQCRTTAGSWGTHGAVPELGLFKIGQGGGAVAAGAPD